MISTHLVALWKGRHSEVGGDKGGQEGVRTKSETKLTPRPVAWLVLMERHLAEDPMTELGMREGGYSQYGQAVISAMFQISEWDSDRIHGSFLLMV